MADHFEIPAGPLFRYRRKWLALACSVPFYYCQWLACTRFHRWLNTKLGREISLDDGKTWHTA